MGAGLLGQGGAPCGVPSDKAAEGCSDEKAGGEQLQALVVVLAVRGVSVAGVLGVVVHVREELLQKGRHAGDAPRDAIVKLQSSEGSRLKHLRPHQPPWLSCREQAVLHSSGVAACAPVMSASEMDCLAVGAVCMSVLYPGNHGRACGSPRTAYHPGMQTGIQ